MKEKLLQQKLELEQKLHLFLSSEYGLKHGDLIQKFKNELSAINEQLQLLEETKHAVLPEEKATDMVLKKLTDKFIDKMEKIELLKSADMDYSHFFNELEKLDSQIDSRLLVLQKIDNLDINDILPPKVKNYRDKVSAIRNQLETNALEQEKASLELSKTQKEQLRKVGIDMALSINEEAFEETPETSE